MESMLFSLKYQVGFTYHLVFMNDLRASLRAYKVEAAVGTATTATANGRNDVAHRVEGNGVARQSFYAANEVGFGDRGTTTCYRIGEDYEVATLEAVAIYPVHYHSGTRLKVGRKPALWNREDSEDVGVDCPYKEQCQH
jgi:hypothetical protein